MLLLVFMGNGELQFEKFSSVSKSLRATGVLSQERSGYGIVCNAPLAALSFFVQSNGSMWAWALDSQLQQNYGTAWMLFRIEP